MLTIVVPAIKWYTKWFPSESETFDTIFQIVIVPNVILRFTTPTISVWLIVQITVDRYIAIYKPLQSHSLRKLQCVMLSVAAIIIGTFLYLVFLAVIGAVLFHYISIYQQTIFTVSNVTFILLDPCSY